MPVYTSHTKIWQLCAIGCSDIALKYITSIDDKSKTMDLTNQPTRTA